MKVLSKRMKSRLQAKSQRVKDSLESINARLAEAVAFGDLRENAAYETDSVSRRVAMQDLRSITDQLSLPLAVVEPGVICIGQLVSVRPISPAGPTMLLLCESEGDPVTAGILSSTSPLGEACFGSGNGIYEVMVYGSSYVYSVEISRDWKRYGELEVSENWLL